MNIFCAFTSLFFEEKSLLGGSERKNDESDLGAVFVVSAEPFSIVELGVVLKSLACDAVGS